MIWSAYGGGVVVCCGGGGGGGRFAARNFGLSSSMGMGRKMPSPLIFEVMNKKFGKTSHVGVLEFAAPKRAAYLPKWMMENLVLTDGDTIQLRLRELPKAAKVTFQPRLYKFTKLPDPVATYAPPTFDRCV